MRVRTHGFTLMELMVVISIIALLIVILLPALQSARATARTIACASNQRQMDIAFHIYADDNDRWLPYWDGGSTSSTESTIWDESIAPYLNYTQETADSGNVREGSHAIFHCPQGQVVEGYSAEVTRNYVINRHVNIDQYDNNRMDTPRMDNRQALLFEAVHRTELNSSGKRKPMTVFDDFSNAQLAADSTSHNAALAFRHNGNMNFLRKDGAVQSTDPGETGSGRYPFWFMRMDLSTPRWWQDGQQRSS
ncbi:MAG: DUF1559 domain-containing protein [Phycisphaeraceae bacterium]